MYDEPDPLRPHSPFRSFSISTSVSHLPLVRSYARMFTRVYVCERARVSVCIGAGSPAPERQAARRAPSLERVSRSTDEDGVCRRRSSESKSGTDNEGTGGKGSG